MHVTDKERNALLFAIDFIYTNSDGADNPTPFHEAAELLAGLHKKAKKEYFKRKDKQNAKKNTS